MHGKWLAAVTAVVMVMGLAWGGQTAQAQSADEIGKSISGLYLEVMQKVVTLMKDRPDLKELTPKLAQLKDETIKQMVELGKKREALDQAGKKGVDRVIEQTMNKLSPDLFKEFSDGNAHYFKLDPELSKLIMDFHMIPQYAVFDNLKQHAPQEAQRLGIK